jgi:predicted HicB family RNase H-like nuclease
MTNKDYTMKVEKQNYEDGSFEWVASFLEIKGIIGVGDTPSEAVMDAEEAKKAFLHALVATNSAIPEANSDISFSGRTTVRMSKRMHKLAFESAQTEGISLNQLIVDAINTYITENNVKRK